ncbi:MAG: hypothetical protein ACRDHZ_21675 [Ktedonobacteraceae bacterium]
MSDQPQSSAKSPAIQLEILPEDEQQQDLGDVTNAGQNILDYLNRNGCIVTPTYTGRMGGPIYDVLVHAYHVIHNNQELLAALFASLAATLKLISDHNKSRETKNTTLTPTPTPVEIEMPTDDGPVTIKAADAEAAIEMLAQFQQTQPEKVKKLALQSKTKIKVSIPKQKWRRKH